VIDYWDKINGAGTTHDDALKEMYKLIEIVTGIYGGEDAAATALAVPLATIKEPKRIADPHD
jgi:hypothetical protein